MKDKDRYQTLPYSTWWPEGSGPKDWFAVKDALQDRIIAYFDNETGCNSYCDMLNCLDSFLFDSQ